jgi:hypothetical protein
MMIRFSTRCAALSACALLAACGGSGDMRETLGLNRKAPDEFRVYSRPPLNVPPEFNLHPPAQGTLATSDTGAGTTAHNRVLEGSTSSASPFSASPSPSPAAPVTAGTSASSADAQFLKNAGADKTDNHIREQIEIDKMNGVTPKDSRYLFGAKKEDDTVVDAGGEADRLKKDKAQNKPPTEGETPVVTPKDKGILGDIF